MPPGELLYFESLTGAFKEPLIYTDLHRDIANSALIRLPTWSYERYVCLSDRFLSKIDCGEGLCVG